MKPAKCFMDNCLNDPEYICKCTPARTLFCSAHARNHMVMKFKKPHEWIDLYFEPNPDSKKIIIKKLNEIKNEIRSCLDKLMLQYGELLETIEKSLSIALEKYYKLNDECDEIILFASQERILNVKTEKGVGKYLKLGPEECKESIQYWKMPEIKEDLSKIKEYIEELYGNLEVNPFKENENEICFITQNNPGQFNSVNLASMTISTKTIDLLQKLHNASSILIPTNSSVFFHGSNRNNNMRYPDSSVSINLIVDEFKNAKIISSGTPATKPLLAYYKSCVYAFGGWTKEYISEKYNLEENKWTKLKSLPTQYCWCNSHSTLFNNFILITAYCWTNMQCYDIKKDTFEIIPNLKLNYSRYKSIFSYDRRAYLFEFGLNIYQSEKDDFSTWQLIGDNRICNSIPQSYSLIFKSNIYFINEQNSLIEFNLKAKELKCAQNSVYNLKKA
ncbi:unnamed protein product [Blepharisma stoltei]|uniref:Uncharacterized protein n=1 Tax=Blepharisma stoltei TaxID=1481888 RepID=A0AAU9JMV3_9CILI|nr:unnamed protein product [Blepharisma stoltei]